MTPPSKTVSNLRQGTLGFAVAAALLVGMIGAMTFAQSAAAQSADDDIVEEPPTIVVRKALDNDHDGKLDLSGADTLVDGWGITVECTQNSLMLGLTGTDGPGTVVFKISPAADEKTWCTISEDGDILTSQVGIVLGEGPDVLIGPDVTFPVAENGEYLLTFLNEPVELPPPPENSSDPVPPQTAPQPAPPDIIVPDDSEPEPEPTEPVIDVVAGEKTPGVTETPLPPDSGTGMIRDSRAGNWTLLFAVALITAGGSFGALAAARRRA